MLRGLHLIFLGKVLQKGIDGLIRTHKVVTADGILVELENCSMQVPLNSKFDPSAKD